MANGATIAQARHCVWCKLSERQQELLKTTIIAIVFLGLGVGLGYRLGADSVSPISAAPTLAEHIVTAPAESRELSDQSHRVADDIQQLREQNRRLTTELESLRKAQPVREVEDAQADASPAIADLEAYYNLRKNSDDFSQYLQNSAQNNGGYVQDLAAKFDAEPVDTQWATDYENRLNSLLESDALANSLIPQSVVCKSRRCQIQVSIASIEQANQVMEAFSAAINNNQLAIDKGMVVSAPDIKSGVMNLYLARDASIKIHE